MTNQTVMKSKNHNWKIQSKKIRIVSRPEDTRLSLQNSIDFIVIPSVQSNSTLANINESDAIEFRLNASASDDQSLIQTLPNDENETAVEPLLFRNQYFTIVSQDNTIVNAMCVICGFDENNQPKKIVKAQKNVSSNFNSDSKNSANNLNTDGLSIKCTSPFSCNEPKNIALKASLFAANLFLFAVTMLPSSNIS